MNQYRVHMTMVNADGATFYRLAQWDSEAALLFNDIESATAYGEKQMNNFVKGTSNCVWFEVQPV